MRGSRSRRPELHGPRRGWPPSPPWHRSLRHPGRQPSDGWHGRACLRFRQVPRRQGPWHERPPERRRRSIRLPWRLPMPSPSLTLSRPQTTRSSSPMTARGACSPLPKSRSPRPGRGNQPDRRSRTRRSSCCRRHRATRLARAPVTPSRRGVRRPDVGWPEGRLGISGRDS